jgi:hypothetical protein
VVTGYEQPGAQDWWVDRGPVDALQPVFVAAAYKGPDKENYHYWWRARPRGQGDLRITAISGDVRIAASARDGRWRNAQAGQALGEGTCIRLKEGAELRWQRDTGCENTGHAKATSGAALLRISGEIAESVRLDDAAEPIPWTFRAIEFLPTEDPVTCEVAITETSSCTGRNHNGLRCEFAQAAPIGATPETGRITFTAQYAPGPQITFTLAASSPTSIATMPLVGPDRDRAITLGPGQCITYSADGSFKRGDADGRSAW